MVTTSTREWLHQKHEQLVPPQAELEAIRSALDAVQTCMEAAGEEWRIAQRYPCGSYAKKTMLGGRKEADLVVVLREAPTDTTLKDLRDLLAGISSVRQAEVLYKAVKLDFFSGVKLDVLPVAKEGITESMKGVPDKLRFALNGVRHVDWFVKAAHGTPIHPTVRLAKAFKGSDSAWKPVRSFAIELLAVKVLRNFDGDLADHFEKFLTEIANGWLADRTLIDPADSANDLVGNLDADQRSRIAKSAAGALEKLQSGNLSSIFAMSSGVLPSSNIGGTTLA